MRGGGIPGTPLMSDDGWRTAVKAVASAAAPPQLLTGAEKTYPLFYPYHFAQDAPCCPDLSVNPLRESCLSSRIKSNRPRFQEVFLFPASHLQERSIPLGLP